MKPTDLLEQSERPILVVEDSVVFAHGLKVEIEDSGLDCVVVGSLSAAVQALDGQEFAAAVVDLTLPDAKESDIVEQVVGRGVPTIVFTGTFDPALRTRILEFPVFDYLLKDTADAMHNVVRHIHRLLRNQRTKILLVDDSPTTRAHIRRELERYRFALLEAESGEAALKVFEQENDLRMALIDYEMPGISGFRLISQLRRKFSKEEAALIGMSSKEDPLLTCEFLKRGANDCINKPFSPEELYNRILLNIEMLERFQTLREQAERLRALNAQKDHFLGIAAHDLRNPLSAITGLTHLLNWDPTDSSLTDEQREQVEMIRTLSDQMNTLVGELLDVAAIESGNLTLEKREACISKLVSERLRLFVGDAAKKQIRLEAKLPELAPVSFDWNRLGQVVDNLVSNAIKFSPPATSVRVRVAPWANGTRSGVEFAVQDQGPGLTPDDHKRIFGSFQQLSARPTGGETSTGLGLSIVKKLVEAHRGTIDVESALGAGACFRVRIPA